MLTLEQYGVKLVRVQEQDIEQIRAWRNQEEISRFMEYKKHITAEDQKAWFRSIDNKHNYFFMIHFDNKNVGVISIKNIDFENNYAEGGIFLGDKNYFDSLAAVYSSLCLLNFTFFVLKFTTSSRIRILKSNTRSIQYNKLIGYKLMPGQDNVENQWYELTLDDYIANGKKLNHSAALLNKDHAELVYSGSVSDKNFDKINKLLILKGQG